MRPIVAVGGGWWPQEWVGLWDLEVCEVCGAVGGGRDVVRYEVLIKLFLG